jgi:phosphatidylglycerophosphate synthase
LSYTLEEVRVLAKREPFRAGVRMRYVMPRVSVRVTHWILNHGWSVTPNQLTAVSAVLGLACGGLLLFPRGIAPVVAAFAVYQLHIVFDYVDGELARVKGMASPLGAYYDLMVGRLTKPAVIGCAVVGTWLGAADAADAVRGLLLGMVVLLGFFLDKEAVDVWYRANAGLGEVEDPYVIRSERSLNGWARVVVQRLLGLAGIQAFLVYHILAAAVVTLGVRHLRLGPIQTTPRGLILAVYAVAFPAMALVRVVYIARTGHVPRRQDLVSERRP